MTRKLQKSSRPFPLANLRTQRSKYLFQDTKPRAQTSAKMCSADDAVCSVDVTFVLYTAALPNIPAQRHVFMFSRGPLHIIENEGQLGLIRATYEGTPPYFRSNCLRYAYVPATFHEQSSSRTVGERRSTL